MEDRLAAEDARKRALLDEEKNIVEQEVMLREQREALEEKEGKLRTTHNSFFHSAGRQSPGRSRSPKYAPFVSVVLSPFSRVLLTRTIYFTIFHSL